MEDQNWILRSVHNLLAPSALSSPPRGFSRSTGDKWSMSRSQHISVSSSDTVSVREWQVLPGHVCQSCCVSTKRHIQRFLDQVWSFLGGAGFHGSEVVQTTAAELCLRVLGFLHCAQDWSPGNFYPCVYLDCFSQRLLQSVGVIWLFQLTGRESKKVSCF